MECIFPILNIYRIVHTTRIKSGTRLTQAALDRNHTNVLGTISLNWLGKKCDTRKQKKKHCKKKNKKIPQWKQNTTIYFQTIILQYMK